MYCGSCLRDNALAAELLARGHEVTLVPLYTPLLTDEPDVTRPQVLFGGISVYLQQYSSLFRRTPRLVDRLLDTPRLIKAFADRSVSTDPRLLGDLTISMLEGSGGVLRKEFDKLLEWTAGEPAPDIINLTNSMLIALARPLAEAFGRPVCCTLQGEDLFLEGLIEPYRTQALDLIRRQIPHVDRFLAISDYYAGFMARYLRIPPEAISVVPLGINTSGFERRASANDGVFRVGYFARVAPEKGLHVLADAYRSLQERTGGARMSLEVAGYLAPGHKAYLAAVKQSLERAGLAKSFWYRGAVDRAGKLAFLRTLDVLSVPATYDEPKGIFLLEAMASGVPVVQPRRGGFTEIVERTGGGLLVEPDAVEGLSDGLHTLWRDPAQRLQLAQQGYEGVRAQYTIQRAADRALAVYDDVIRARRPPVAKAVSNL
jgi:glycosyltransferase involved in cell wall biosynthesis